jgi:hypothetical protein
VTRGGSGPPGREGVTVRLRSGQDARPALTAFSSHASRLHFFRKLLSARIVLADVVIPSAFPVTFGPHVQPARDPLQVSAFLKPAARASSSEQNQRFGFFSVR